MHWGLSQNGDTIYKAEYKKSNLNGQWMAYYANGQPYDSGRFSSNMPDGEWKTWYPNGTLRSVRTFNASKYRSIKNNLIRYNAKTNFDPLLALEKQRPGTFHSNTDAYRSSKSTVPKSCDPLRRA